MIPILFPYNATDFTTHGLGDLMETMRCESTLNESGEYEIELEYPADGSFTSKLIIDNIIVAKVDDYSPNQAFRIYGIEKTINQSILVHAQHISYDLSNYVSTIPLYVEKDSVKTCGEAISCLASYFISGGNNQMSFNFDTNVATEPQNQDRCFFIEEPVSMRAALLDGDDSIKGTFGGDLIFDNFDVHLYQVGGADRGVLIEYGIDLIDVSQEENISEMVTGVYPYWKGRPSDNDETYKSWTESHPDGDLIIAAQPVYAAGNFKKHHLVPLNVNEYWVEETVPDAGAIQSIATEWIQANEIGQPAINLTLSYADLPKNKEIHMHDAVTVRFVKIGIDLKAKVVSYSYDTLLERCTEIEVGKAKPSILFDLEDASRLKRGLIPPKRIQNKSIGSDKLANSSVGSGQLANDSVSNWHLKDDSVTKDKIGQEQITSYHLGPLSVTEGKIQDGAVTETKIGDNTIKADHLKDGEIVVGGLGHLNVTSGSAAEGKNLEMVFNNGIITVDQFKDGEIDIANLGKISLTSASVGEAKDLQMTLGNDIITADQLKSGEVNKVLVGNSAITSVNIQDGAVVQGKIGNEAIYFENIAAAQIDTLTLNDFSITSTKVSADSGMHYNLQTKQWEICSPAIDTDNLSNGAVDSDKIMDSAIVTMKIADKNVATIKLEQYGQDSIAAVWRLDDIVADHIWSNGAISCSTIIVDGTQFNPGSFSVIDGNGLTRTVYGLFQAQE